MSYYPSTGGFSSEEEEVLRVHLHASGTTSDISLHRFVSGMNISSRSGSEAHIGHEKYGNQNPYQHIDGQGQGHIAPQQQQQSLERQARRLPQLNPLNLINNFATNTNNSTTAGFSISQPQAQQQSQDSPFLRRLGEIRRSSAEFSIANFRQNYAGAFSGGSGSIAQDGNVVGGGVEEFDDNSLGGVDGDPSGETDPAVKASSSSESQALYGNENVVKELRPDYARWFYKYEQDRTWTPFTGYDSIRMEHRYRSLTLEREMNNYPVGGSNSGLDIDNTNEMGSSSTNYYSATGFSLDPSQIPSQQAGHSGHASPIPNYSSANSSVGAASPHCGGVSPNPSYQSQSGQYDGTGTSSTEPEDENCKENVIIVRGGLYEADLETWSCVATYWPGDKCLITRGTWFYDGTWQPLSVEHAEKLEEEHLGQFAGVLLAIYAQTNGGSQPDSPTKKNRPVVHRVSFCEFHVDWTSPTEIHLFSKAASYKFMRSVGQRLGFQTWGHRLCRGYCKPASIVDRPSEISHLVFVVHGIGQKMDTGRIVRNCASFRETVSSLKEKFFPHLNETKQRAEFFPVEWRSAAKLDGDVVDAITPHKLLSLRQLLNATAMDIMYYTSPLYRTEIQNALRNELNRIYSNFVKRNPDFRSRGGKVSVIAHSLGAVITYDIITGYMAQSIVPEPPQPYKMSSSGGNLSNGYANNQLQSVAEQLPGLLFQLEHFFCLGSPLSVFLALRWREPYNPSFRSFILPKLLCKRIYNVFYSTDPVAYRLEPLLNKQYVHIAPLPVYAYGSLGRPKYEEMPRERINKEVNFRSPPEPNPNYNAQSDSNKSTPQRNLNNLKSPPTPTKESNWGWGTLMKYLNRGENPGTTGNLEGELASELMSPDGNSSPGRGDSTPEDLSNEISNDLEYRMDYVLKESNFSSTYLAALTSHTSYWSSPDTAFFVLTHLYGSLLDEPSPTQQAQ